MKKKILKSIGLFFGLIILVIVAYVIFVFSSYYRIEDKQTLEIENNQSNDTIDVNKEYTISTYNIGFGAHSQDYTFFMDSGETKEGKETKGKWAKARSEEEVQFNTSNAIQTIIDLNPDFCLFQEVDTSSTRSHFIDQYQMIKNSFNNYSSTFGVNFHSVYLPYPLHDMHGRVNAGIATLSRYKIESSTRYSLTVAEDFSKLFDLDRCFVANEIQTSNDNKLIIVNIHMSAYDEGGIIREKQLNELNSYLEDVKQKGYYVIVGGDFNHDLLINNPLYNYSETTNPFINYISHKKPVWLQMFFKDDKTCDITEGYQVICSSNAPTSRDISVEWEIGQGYVTTIDGFIISDNIEAVSCDTIVTKGGNKDLDHFAFSDHDPVILKFKFK